MGLYNFQPRFVPAIESGEKCHTIRAPRKNPDKPGNVMHLYTGLRHKGARLLMRVPCVKVQEVSIRPSGIAIDGVDLSPDEREQLAIADGFASWQEMLDFWSDRLETGPWLGNLLHWRKPK